MPTNGVIVIGASSGGVDALRILVAGLPADFGTPICIVLHIAPHAPGILHQMLARAGSLPTFKVQSDMPLRAPGIYVAPPDFHLLVEKDKVRIAQGPRENRFRPAIDPLFRSAAYSYGPAAIGIVLTGDLDDGTSGLWAIKEHGGVALVQDPVEAPYPSMPRSAIQHVPVDHVVPIAAVAPLLMTLTTRSIEGPAEQHSSSLETEIQIAYGEDAREVGVLQLGQPSMYTCPDCHGVLLEVQDSRVPRFRCHTGHAYSIESLAATVFEKTEDAMWSAIRSLDEGASLLEKLARHLEEHHDGHGAATHRERAMLAKRRADLLQAAVSGNPGVRANEGVASRETPGN
jgi:two-component system chemotaxis response regulator CheB